MSGLELRVGKFHWNGASSGQLYIGFYKSCELKERYMQIRAESIEGLASKIVSDYFLKSSPINPTAELDESLKKMIGLLELDKKEFEDFVEELNRKRWQADFSRMP